MKTMLALVALTAALAAPAVTAAPPLVTLKAAITKTYAPKRVVLGTVCRHEFRGNGYALVKVRVAGVAGHLVALQFINGEGWFVMWYDGKYGKGVPVSQRANVRAEVARLKAKCLAP